jgi:hypothetical protein
MIRVEISKSTGGVTVDDGKGGRKKAKKSKKTDSLKKVRDDLKSEGLHDG